MPPKEGFRASSAIPASGGRAPGPSRRSSWSSRRRRRPWPAPWRRGPGCPRRRAARASGGSRREVERCTDTRPQSSTMSTRSFGHRERSGSALSLRGNQIAVDATSSLTRPRFAWCTRGTRAGSFVSRMGQLLAHSLDRCEGLAHPGAGEKLQGCKARKGRQRTATRASSGGARGRRPSTTSRGAAMFSTNNRRRLLDGREPVVVDVQVLQRRAGADTAGRAFSWFLTAATTGPRAESSPAPRAPRPAWTSKSGAILSHLGWRRDVEHAEADKGLSQSEEPIPRVTLT